MQRNNAAIVLLHPHLAAKSLSSWIESSLG